MIISGEDELTERELLKKYRKQKLVNLAFHLLLTGLINLDFICSA